MQSCLRALMHVAQDPTFQMVTSVGKRSNSIQNDGERHWYTIRCPCINLKRALTPQNYRDPIALLQDAQRKSSRACTNEANRPPLGFRRKGYQSRSRMTGKTVIVVTPGFIFVFLPMMPDQNMELDAPVLIGPRS